MSKSKWAIGSEWEEGLLCELPFNTRVFSNDFEDGGIFSGKPLLFDTKNAAMDFSALHGIQYAYPVEFDFYLHF